MHSNNNSVLRSTKKNLLFLAIILHIFTIFSHARANEDLERIGDIIQIALPTAAAAYSLGKNDKDGLKQGAYSLIATNAITFGLKYTVNARRPNGGCHSFPSGHTSTAFAASTYMWKRYGYEYGLPMTILAGFVGYTRIEADKHFFGDVAAGAAIGIAASWFFTTKYGSKISVTPQGLTFKMDF